MVISSINIVWNPLKVTDFRLYEKVPHSRINTIVNWYYNNIECQFPWHDHHVWNATRQTLCNICSAENNGDFCNANSDRIHNRSKGHSALLSRLSAFTSVSFPLSCVAGKCLLRLAAPPTQAHCHTQKEKSGTRADRQGVKRALYRFVGCHFQAHLLSSWLLTDPHIDDCVL